MSQQPVIYLISWTNNPYFYIGQAQSFNQRKYSHVHELRKGSHHNAKLQNIFKKYGEPEFQILEYVEVSELNKVEQWYLDEFVGKENCLNLAKFAEASARGLKRSEEIKKKIGKVHKGKTLSIETKQKISEARKGMKFSEEHKQKLLEAHYKPILQYSKDREFIREWKSLTEATETLKIQISGISACCRGKRKSTGGFIWKYKDY